MMKVSVVSVWMVSVLVERSLGNPFKKDLEEAAPQKFQRFKLLSVDVQCSITNSRIGDCNREVTNWEGSGKWQLLTQEGCKPHSGVNYGITLIGNVPGLWHEGDKTEWVHGGELRVMSRGRLRVQGILSAKNAGVHSYSWEVDIMIEGSSTTASPLEINWIPSSLCCPANQAIPPLAVDNFKLYTRATGNITNLHDGFVTRVVEATVPDKSNAAHVQIGCGASALNPSFGIRAYFSACDADECKGILVLSADLRK